MEWMALQDPETGLSHGFEERILEKGKPDIFGT
jgi:hypothetical protein